MDSGRDRKNFSYLKTREISAGTNDVNKLKNCFFSRFMTNNIYKYEKGDFTLEFYNLVGKYQNMILQHKGNYFTKSYFRSEMEKLICDESMTEKEVKNTCKLIVMECCDDFIDDIKQSPFYYGKELANSVTSTIINNIKKIIPPNNTDEKSDIS
ncbi:uncharacterized protein LOC126904065 [Daktulosphaira vitifoliae]|uniref:uncharacterized protein LOC126904065 n=1 Tax=Daktulosphaira vitifoliae TaxID=58002 RepID=UPI0021AADD67|nr:uncharacterized protein LOC126904065 [Daktulosphaira vitifoliae]